MGIILMVGLFASSCATIFQGTTKRVLIISHTPDTKIYVNGRYRGLDAVTVRLPRGKDYGIIFEKKGYKTQHAFIDSNPQVIWLFLGFLWLPGLLVDLFTSSWYTFSRTRVIVELEEEPIPLSNMLK